MRKIVAIVGPMASGKGALVEIFKKNGYISISLSDVVRRKTSELGLPVTRTYLQDVGDQLRRKFGRGILTKLVSPIMNQYAQKNFVIDGIRNPAEITYLKRHFHATIIGVVASADNRFQMMLSRHRSQDPETREEFDKLELRDRGVGQTISGQQVDASLKMSDFVISNNGTLSDFQKNSSILLKNIL